MKRELGDQDATKNLPAAADPTVLEVRRREVAAALTAENTRRSYRSALRHYRQWGGDLPADSYSVESYLLTHAESHSPRTLAARLAALSWWHERQGFPDPTRMPAVRDTLRGIRRRYGGPPKKAPPLAMESVEALVKVLAADSTDLAALRDAALLQVGFFGTLRRSELVGIQVADLEWTSAGVTIVLPRSKTDQEAQGCKTSIPFAPGAPLCPASALRTWLDAAGIVDGPVFRRVDRWGHGGRRALDPGSVTRILRARAEAGGVEKADRLTSHSLRRGFATSAYLKGVDFLKIKHQGRWKKDETVQEYIDEAKAFEDNAAGDLLLRKPRG